MSNDFHMPLQEQVFTSQNSPYYQIYKYRVGTPIQAMNYTKAWCTTINYTKVLRTTAHLKKRANAKPGSYVLHFVESEVRKVILPRAMQRGDGAEVVGREQPLAKRSLGHGEQKHGEETGEESL